MPRRPSGNAGTTPSVNLVPGSYLDEVQGTLRIPVGLDPEVRKRVKNTLELNPFLGQPQMAAVIRYARLQIRFEQIEAQIDQEGVTVIDRYGNDKEHPLLKFMNSTQGALVTQERNLAISVPTRREQIAKSEEKPRTRKEPKGKAPTGRPDSLRLA